jgi:hypothetical protein
MPPKNKMMWHRVKNGEKAVISHARNHTFEKGRQKGDLVIIFFANKPSVAIWAVLEDVWLLAATCHAMNAPCHRLWRTFLAPQPATPFAAYCSLAGL